MDHDVSLLVPEIWCRLGHEERNPRWLIEHGMLEPLKDDLLQKFGGEFANRLIPASRLGYRITHKFVNAFFGRIFNQDGSTFARIQRGLHASVQSRTNLARYQDSRIRHFHATLDEYLAGAG